jgi:murein DD-endopeptidase MepM/ murein hydrolase activator NlpD
LHVISESAKSTGVAEPEHDLTGNAAELPSEQSSPEQPNVVAVIAEQLIGQSDQTTVPVFNAHIDSEIQPGEVDIEQQSEQPVIGLIQKPQDEMNTTPADSAVQVENPAKTLTTYLQSQPWISSTVKKGDSLSKILNRNDIGARHAYEITQYEDAASLLKIRPGQKIDIKKNAQGEFAQLQYRLDKFNTLSVLAVENDYIVEVHTRDPEIRLNNAKATIYQNLLGAADNAGISLNTMYNFIALFGWQVDFTMDIHVGDQFSIIYEELYLDNKKVGNGNIIAAELVVSGKKLQAVRHEDEDGFISYFAPNGDGIKGTFLRSPLKFGHVTSNFSNNRLHPIKKVWTAHRGVDYGAPRGTPILATGDGTIRHAGTKGGYGKTVIIRHGARYDTVYAHLNGYAKGVRSGTRVKQGDVIGYVGSSGLATGPHLHYEFRINGVHKNPVTVALPKSAPISDKYKSQFLQSAGIWVAELDYLNRIPLAQNQVNQ